MGLLKTIFNLKNYFVEEKKFDFFVKFPLDIQKEICSYLSTQDLGYMSQVCKLWQTISLHEDIWKAQARKLQLEIPFYPHLSFKNQFITIFLKEKNCIKVRNQEELSQLMLNIFKEAKKTKKNIGIEYRSLYEEPKQIEASYLIMRPNKGSMKWPPTRIDLSQKSSLKDEFSQLDKNQKRFIRGKSVIEQEAIGLYVSLSNHVKGNDCELSISNFHFNSDSLTNILKAFRICYP